jgi:trehalose monomycolate/heme transporter
MRLLGRANWYAPGPPRRLYVRYGIRESVGEPAPRAGERELAAAR